MVAPAVAGTPDTDAASNLQSVVYFDAKGEKVLNALGYDKSGKLETLSAFYYWDDDSNTARREDKNIQKIRQWATLKNESDLTSYFGATSPLATAVAGTPETDAAANLQSVVYFDAKGEKVLNALGYDKSGKLETLSAFY